MAAVADLERLLERVFERTTARLFRARVQPVQVERHVERAMERGRTRRGEATLVPSRFRVRLNPVDVDELAARSGGPEALAGRLADSALTFARLHGYHVAARPAVTLVADPSVERGRMEVDALGAAPRSPDAAPAAPLAREPAPSPASEGAAQPSPGAVATPAPSVALAMGSDPAPEIVPPAGSASQVDGAAPSEAFLPAVTDAPAPPAPAARAPMAPAAAATGIRGDGDRTLVYRRPAPEPARALLRVTSRAGGERTVEVDGTPLTIGRGPDNALVLADARVSRHHGRLQARRGTLVYTDLGSTNGSRVNGIRVDEIVLGAGDRLQVGDTVLVVEHLPG